MKLFVLFISAFLLIGMLISCDVFEDKLLKQNQNFDTVNLVMNLSAKDILIKTKNKYDSIVYYRSLGVAEYPVNSIKAEKPLLYTNFEFVYYSPYNLKLNWSDSKDNIKNKFIVDQDQIFLKDEKGLVKKYNNLISALLEISNNDDASRFDVPNLLILKSSPYNKSFIDSLTNSIRLEDESVDGHLCFKIQSEVKGLSTVKITHWVDFDSFLIRKVERRIEVGKDKTIYYQGKELLKVMPEIYTRVETYKEIEAK